MEWLLSSGFLVFLAQMACAMHLFRHGGSLWWLLPILFFPPLGILFYVIFEVIGKGSSRGQSAGGVELREVGGERLSLKELREAAELSPTVENQVNLARRLLNGGKASEAAEAVALFEGCLQGVYRDDPNLRYELAEAYHAVERAENTLEQLDWLEIHEYRDYGGRRALLRAIAMGRAGQTEAALAEFERILPSQSGEQARYEYARLLQAAGRTEDARKVVAEMFERRPKHDGRYRRREAEWYRAARKLAL